MSDNEKILILVIIFGIVLFCFLSGLFLGEAIGTRDGLVYGLTGAKVIDNVVIYIDDNEKIQSFTLYDSQREQIEKFNKKEK